MAGTIVTQHAKQRIQERNELVTSAALAKRNAKIAYNSGYKIHQLRHCPRITAWMRRKGENGKDPPRSWTASFGIKFFAVNTMKLRRKARNERKKK